MESRRSMTINDHELTGYPLWTFRSLFGEKRSKEIGGLAVDLAISQCFSADELACFAEHFRLFAEVKAMDEERKQEKERVA